MEEDDGRECHQAEQELLLEQALSQKDAAKMKVDREEMRTIKKIAIYLSGYIKEYAHINNCELGPNAFKMSKVHAMASQESESAKFLIVIDYYHDGEPRSVEFPISKALIESMIVLESHRNEVTDIFEPEAAYSFNLFIAFLRITRLSRNIDKFSDFFGYQVHKGFYDQGLSDAKILH